MSLKFETGSLQQVVAMPVEQLRKAVGPSCSVDPFSFLGVSRHFLAFLGYLLIQLDQTSGVVGHELDALGAKH